MLEVEQLSKTIEKDKKTTELMKQELEENKEKLVKEKGLEMADDYTKKKRVELRQQFESNYAVLFDKKNDEQLTKAE